MDKKTFLSLCHSEFIKRGFRKHRNMYFLSGEDGILCGIWLKKSNYGPVYTIQYYYFLGEFSNSNQYPTRYEFDLCGHINVESKVTFKGECFMTGRIEYEKYTVEELLPYFENDFNQFVLPPILHGKSVLLECHDHLICPPKKEYEDILPKINCK